MQGIVYRKSTLLTQTISSRPCFINMVACIKVLVKQRSEKKDNTQRRGKVRDNMFTGTEYKAPAARGGQNRKEVQVPEVGVILK